MDYRIYAIVRTDLPMESGKMGAQIGHTILDTFVRAQQIRPEIISDYFCTGGIKIIMRAKSQKSLERAYVESIEKNLPAALIVDWGRHGWPAHMLGQNWTTALGLGPVHRDEIGNILRGFQLLN